MLCLFVGQVLCCWADMCDLCCVFSCLCVVLVGRLGCGRFDLFLLCLLVFCVVCGFHCMVMRLCVCWFGC